MEVNAADLWTLLLSTIRYSLGRQTYMVQYSTELFERYGEALTVMQRLQIAREILQEVERCERQGKTCGSEGDHVHWKTFVKHYNAETGKLERTSGP